MRLRSLVPPTLVLTLFSPSLSAAESGAPEPPPRWYLEHLDFLARDGGVFHTDNSRYRSADEPWEAYGLSWEKGPSRQTLRGRLFGLRGGEDAGTFWELFVFWHPQDRKAYIYQVGGDGTLGRGTLEPPDEDGTQRSEQTFYHVGGATTRIAHLTRDRGETHETESFDWVEGAWTPRRSYTWLRVGRAAEEASAPQRSSEWPHAVTGGWADLRNDAVLEAGDAERARGRALLVRTAERHGLAAWHGYSTLTVVERDDWDEPGPWWPAQSQLLRLDQLNGTFTSRAELLDGPGQGQIWGVQSWRGYKVVPPAREPRFTAERDGALAFYLPSLHYFNELPFRLLAAPTIVHAGEARLEERDYELVFVSWDEGAPSGEHDQYVLWIANDSGFVEKAHYTVREAAAMAPAEQAEVLRAGAVGTIHYGDYRDVGGVAIPFLQVVTLFGPEQAVPPVAENFFHRVVLSEARWDAVAPSALQPDPTLPPAADRKPTGR
jgi:hypothetical protein